jgi:uncharacterized membrane protein YphA (DoxX/SURF4 family)
MLVLLRITIGWHFLYSGLWKLSNPDFSSEGFLSQAKGPFAAWFYAMVPDFYGRERLDPDNWPALVESLETYLENFEETYALRADQSAMAQKIVEGARHSLSEYLEENREAIEEHLDGLDRLETARADPASGTPFMQERIWSWHTELRGRAKAWLAEIDRIGDECVTDLAALLSDEQARQGTIEPPSRRTMWQDRFITWTNIVIGACLIAGLFTRLASLSGAAFLLLVVLAQPDWPGLIPAPPPSAGRAWLVTKEFVEMMALACLAATRVGRWGGFDFFLHHYLVRPLFRRKEQ